MFNSQPHTVSVGREKRGHEPRAGNEVGTGGRIKQIDLNGELKGCSGNFDNP